MTTPSPSPTSTPTARPLRVLLLCQTLALPGGVERFACALASHLGQVGFDTALGSADGPGTVVAYRLAPEVRLLTVRSAASAPAYKPAPAPASAPGRGIRRAWVLLRHQWRTGRALAGLIRAERPDVVILNGLTTACSVLLLCPGGAARTICCDHNHFDARSRPWRWLRRRLYPRVAALVSLTEADAPKFRALNPRTEVIPNASSLHRDAPPDEAPTHGRPPLVLAIGRCVAQKGFDLLLQAWHLLMQRMPPSAARLRVVGDGPLREALVAQTRQLGIESSVEWLPPCRDIARHYREAAIFVLPSRYEGLPLVLLEAQALGLPTVAFDCPTGPAEVIAAGTGLVVPAQDVTALADALATLLAQPALRQAMGRAAWQHSRDHFSPDAHFARWTALVRTVAAHGVGHGAGQGAGQTTAKRRHA